MTTSPLKVEDSRADFESWYKQTFMVGDYWIEKRRCEPESYTIGSGILIYWECWKAARAEIVVELPEPHAHLIWIQAGHAPDDYWDDVEVSRSKQDKCCDGSDRYAVYAEHEVAEMLAAAGITVKGDS